MVVVHHIADLHLRTTRSLRLEFLEMCQAGVDIFFVVSGFIMWQTTTLNPTTPAAFMGKRITRIIPLYWLATLLMFAALFVSTTIGGGRVAGPVDLLASLICIPFGDRFWPIYPPGWTINYEMFFYAVFTICLFVNEKRARMACLMTALLGLVVAGQVYEPQGIMRWYTAPILLEFAAGVLIAACFAARMKVPDAVAGAALATGLAILFFSDHPDNDIVASRVANWGLSASLVVFGAVFLDRNHRVCHMEGLRFLGDASYSLYLTHLFSVGAVAILWHKLNLWSFMHSGVVFFIVSFAASIAAAAFVHLLVEKPLLELARTGSWSRRRRTERPAIAPR
jgi:exopolysaccharide production protein ExoZ